MSKTLCEFNFTSILYYYVFSPLIFWIVYYILLRTRTDGFPLLVNMSLYALSATEKRWGGISFLLLPRYLLITFGV